MRYVCLWISVCCLAWTQLANAQELNVLVIGSTHSFSEGEIGGSGVVHEKPFNPTTIATHLQGILSRDAAITAVTPKIFVDIEVTQD